MKKLVGVMIACLLVFSLVSCAGLKKSEIVGTYELISFAAGSTSYTEEQLSTLKAAGKTATLEIREDNTATMDLFGMTNEMTYNKGQNVKATFKDGILTLKDNSGTMEFRKIS